MRKLTCTFLILTSAFTARAADPKLPPPDSAFGGKVAPDRDASVPDWPRRSKPTKDAPNVIVILLDDVGFGATSVFGGPVPTPELERLAAAGLRYNRFHVNAMCSPTRAALLSGRNSHQMGFGNIAEWAAGYPGYNALWPRNSVSVAEVLKQNGYSTAAFGKWHNTPPWEINPSGPFDRWPTGLGFEYFYGFLGAQTSQWEPSLYRNTTPVEPEITPGQGYHLTADLVDDAIQWVHRHDDAAPETPFFLYFATGATHVPHHVPAEWIARFKGQFDEGWDVLREKSFARQKELGVIPTNAQLTPRPKEIPGWSSLLASEQKLVIRQMEVYAAFLAHTDYEIGRLLRAVREDGHNEDTAIFYIVGDNGASAEGGVTGRDEVNVSGKAAEIDERLALADDLGGEMFLNHYATSWAWALDSPFQWSKEVASHLGGTRDPLIISWPGHISQAGGLRSQFSHVNDIAPTIYEIASITPPTEVNGISQTPLEGVSLVYTFDHANAPERHHIQYFEMLGSRGIYKDGWWAGSFNHLPWPTPSGYLPNPAPETKPWELYRLDEDFSQARNLSGQNPEKLKELQVAFESEAQRNHVYPLEPRRDGQPSIAEGRNTFSYREGRQRITATSAPRLAGRAHVITADLKAEPGHASGVIVAQGGRYGGFTLYAEKGGLIYESNINGHRVARVVASKPIPSGSCRVGLEFKPDESTPVSSASVSTVGRLVPGTLTLFLNGKSVGSAHIAGIGPNTDTFDIGYDRGSPVSTAYSSPFPFSGQIAALTVELK